MLRLPGWWPFAVHAVSFFAVPAAWLMILGSEHVLLLIMAGPPLIIATWAATIAGMVSGWRFDRGHQRGTGRAAGFASIALLALIVPGLAFALGGLGRDVAVWWAVLAALCVFHGMCMFQIMAPGRRAEVSVDRPSAPAGKADRRPEGWRLVDVTVALLAIEAVLLVVAAALAQELTAVHRWLGSTLSNGLLATLSAGLAVGISMGLAASTGRPAAKPAGLLTAVAATGTLLLTLLVGSWYWSMRITPLAAVLIALNTAKTATAWRATGSATDKAA